MINQVNFQKFQKLLEIMVAIDFEHIKLISKMLEKMDSKS